jgi:hypothetical protein
MSKKKLTKDDIEHKIFLKKIEIENYKRVIVNYPADRMEKCGIPFLNKLKNDLQLLERQLIEIE